MVKFNKSIEDKMQKYYIPNKDTFAINRAKILNNFIEKNINISKNNKILDIGFGGGSFLKKINSKINTENLYGLDISNTYLENLPKKFKKKNFDIFDFSAINLKKDNYSSDGFLKENYFNIVFSSDVLEHVFDPINFIENMIYLSNNYIILNIPLEVNLKNRLNLFFGQNIHDPFNVGGHIRFFKPKDFIKYINKNYKNQLEIINIEYDTWFDTDNYFNKGIKYKLANSFPNLFAGRMSIILKKL